ncbi:hypothetical protein FH972_021356 [Carpinus fangiana]|uniref:Hydroxymethylglutaryl-coenzyme A synthase N-terminal domain-containing protein n=1 Tax=Carpinus fangiana TaxID=176857 RepID=A0A5N6KP44_9ROSI|nr:hypothetical protein FH972_021356 [Carpinus fangiana]
MSQPSNVGIKAIEIYFPGQTLDQAQFEAHQSVSAGKYTIGLGQKLMNFCNDREGTNLVSIPSARSNTSRPLTS